MNSNKHIHTFFNINSKYTYVASICISSILSNLNKDYKISFYILSKDLKEEDKEKLQSLKHIKEYDIEFIEIDESVFTKKIESSQTHISFETNYRFLASSVKPNLDKCIYLDVDLIVLGDLSKLWEINIDEYYMAGVMDQLPLIWKEGFEKLPLAKDYLYVNTGVTVFNLKKWREDDIEKKLLEGFERYSSIIKYPDQDVLNISLQGKVKYLDLKYNAMPVQQYKNEKFYKQAFKDPFIVHWAGYRKPWIYAYVKYGNEFLKYAKKLPFYDEFMYKYTKLIDKECLQNYEDKFKTLYDLKPVFDNSINICSIFDWNYAPYFAVLLQSIIEHSSPDMNYDIVILYNNDISKTYMQKISSMIKQDNISLRFVDIYLFISEIKENYDFHIKGHFSESTYYRFLIPKLFKEYKKLIYIDTDTIALKDLKEFYAIDLDDKFLGVVRDTVILAQKYDTNTVEYIEKKLNLDSYENYFNAGVLLFDIAKCNSIDFLDLCLEKLKELEKPRIVDQCVLNSIMYKKVKFIPLRWNYLWNTNIKNRNLNIVFNDDFYEEFKDSFTNHYIIHYCDSFKPWNSPHLEKADIWWSYARKTPFYEEILYKNSPMPYKAGAVNIIQSHLSYKLGKEILSVKDNKLKILILPITIPWIYILHFTSKAFNNLLASSNGLIKPEPMHHYSDNHEAIRIKNHLTYRLGNTLVKHPFTFLFRISKVYKEWKREKNAK